MLNEKELKILYDDCIYSNINNIEFIVLNNKLKYEIIPDTIKLYNEGTGPFEYIVTILNVNTKQKFEGCYILLNNKIIIYDTNLKLIN